MTNKVLRQKVRFYKWIIKPFFEKSIYLVFLFIILIPLYYGFLLEGHKGSGPLVFIFLSLYFFLFSFLVLSLMYAFGDHKRSKPLTKKQRRCIQVNRQRITNKILSEDYGYLPIGTKESFLEKWFDQNFPTRCGLPIVEVLVD